MSEDIQSLLEKINREGVEKARAEAEQIVAAAKAEAERILKAAANDAAKAKADAQKEAADYAARAAETIRQAERDTILSIESAVTALFEKLLVHDVDRALADEKTAVALASDAVRALTGPVEIAARPELAAALKAQLAAQKEITVVTDEAMDAGFTVRTENGRVEHTFTSNVIAEELAKRLRPDLAALLK